MIVHKTFTEITAVLIRGNVALDKQDKLRKKVEEFIAQELKDDDVINVTEMLNPSLGSLFSVTVWYRKG